ncbi:MAG: RNA-directed DNA polymerase [Planctomycetota bacterium]|jgi:RNA-directed DNA polymerase
MSSRAKLWQEVTGFEALCRAARRAAKGKRQRAGVARFMERLEPNVLVLQQELETGSYRPGEPQCFEIHDPKRRTISAAPFRDRVVHHALMAPLEPLFEGRMLPHSFACRRGKGTHAALDHAQRLVRSHLWFHRFDVARCFDSIRHDVVIASVERSVRDPRVRSLFECVIRSGGVEGRGLPIGSLTSQWSANLILDRLDHFVLERLRPGGYVRYMDDFVLFASGKPELREMRRAVCAFLEDELDLRAKERSLQLARCRDGLPFLGWRIYPRLRRIRPQNLRRIRQRMRRSRRHLRRGHDEDAVATRVRATIEHLLAGNTHQLVRGWVHPPRTV